MLYVTIKIVKEVVYVIGENIANLRKKKDLTQEQLANLIGVSAKTISAYETNRSLPNIEILLSLSKTLDANIDTILGINKNNAKEISKTYEKYNFKENIFKIIFIALIFIIPIIFFYWAGYVSIVTLISQYYAFGSFDVATTLNFFNGFVIEYIVYLVLMFIFYILYQKKYYKTLFVISSLIIISVFAEGYIFIIFAVLIIDLLLIKFKKMKIMGINNLLVTIISIILMLVEHTYVSYDIYIFVFLGLIGIIWSKDIFIDKTIVNTKG